MYGITRQDVAQILEKHLIENVYTSYMGYSASDEKRVNELLAGNTLLSLKAFFCPSHIVVQPPRDYAIGQMMQQAMSPTPDQDKVIDKGLAATLNCMSTLRGTTPETIKRDLMITGFQRRYEILTKHFMLGADLVTDILIKIIKQTNDTRKQTPAAQKPQEGDPAIKKETPSTKSPEL